MESDLSKRIASAKTLKEVNELRGEVVDAMKTPGILKQWQDKYWGLKTCPTCGRERE